MEDARNALIADEILVGIRHLTFGLHAVDIDHVGVYTIEDLGACGTPKCMGIGKVCVSCHCLLSLIAVEPGELGLDMLSHWEA